MAGTFLDFTCKRSMCGGADRQTDSEHALVPGFGSGLVAVQGPDFGPQRRSAMSAPNHSVADDRGKEPKSSSKRLLQGPEGDLSKRQTIILYQ